ncbi:MAG: MraY family glycosyltransferase [Candidatus Gracilibacteria bacterium]|jgi:UDP-GlcNAc:undecaprenyl-phosphate GlcNAc-1-phosphate transferase
MNILQAINQYWWIALSSFLLSVVFTKLAVKFFPKLGLMDRPLKYGLSRAPIPYYGGVAIFLAFIISVLLFVPIDPKVFGLIMGAFIIVFVGFFDDFFSLNPFIRLIFQMIAGLILAVVGIGVLSINLPIIGSLDFSEPVIFGIKVFVWAFTVVWVMSIINAMNLLDGVSGLNSGVSFIAGITMFFLSINPSLHENLASQAPVAKIALILAMVALGFLLFDFPKAKILMGDTGSTFFGFIIATLAIFSGGKVATAFLVLGIVILDMFWVILRRTLEKKPFWKGDLKHLHHRLLSAGFSERKVVLMYMTVCGFFGISAVFLVSSMQKLFMIIAMAVLMIVLAIDLVFFKK